MKVVAITQARTGSTRLPKKILLEIAEKTLLEIHVNRIQSAKKIDEIIIATTTNTSDDVVEKLSKEYNVQCHRGSENDVLDRFYQAVKEAQPDYVVRLTSDCPLIDPALIDEVVERAIQLNVDYYANIIEEKYPDGQDIEVMKFSALEKAWKESSLQSDREHVTPYIRNHSSYKGGTLFTSDNHNLEADYNHVRLTVDEPSDFAVINQIIENLGLDKDWKTYADYYLKNDEIRNLNKDITRNEGYLKTLQQDKDI